MKRLRIAVLLVILSSVAGVAAAESAIPDRFVNRWGDLIWVSAEEALSSDGSVREGLNDVDRRKLHRRREALIEQRRGLSTQQAGGCDVEFIGYVSQGGEGDVKTFADLREIAAARTVISGTVTASAVGLHNGMPHTVLNVESDSVDRIHVIYPHGRIQLENMTVCNADPMYSELPAVGDAITVIVSKPFDASGTLYWPAGSSILYEHDGVLVIAPYLRDDLQFQRFKSLGDATAALHTRPIPESRRQ